MRDMPLHAVSGEILQDVRTVIRKKEKGIVRFTRDILRIPSVNHPPGGDEKGVQEFIAAKLRDLGLDVDIFELNRVRGLTKHKAYTATGCGGPARDYNGRPDVVGRIKGRGGGKSLILTAHVDVVPVVKEDKWKHRPWEAEIEGGKIYGRGAVDDKGPLAAMLMAVESILEAGITLNGDLIIESVVDEEFGGANGTLATIVKGYRADGVIVGEPTNLEICPSTYGCQCMEVHIKGRSVHPFEKWKGEDPVGLGLIVYEALSVLERKRSATARRLPFLSGKVIPAPVTVPIFESGALKGGAMAEECRMELWFATLPGERQAGLLRQVREILEREAVSKSPWFKKNPPEVRLIGRQLEASVISPRHALVENLSRAVRSVTKKEHRMTCGTSGDLFLYTNYGRMPAVLFGPGQIHCAHGVDECIKICDLMAAVRIYALMILTWCGVAKD